MITAFQANYINNTSIYPTSFKNECVDSFLRILTNEIQEAAKKNYHHVIYNLKDFDIDDIYVIADVLITHGYNVHVDVFTEYARILFTWDANNNLIYSVTVC